MVALPNILCPRCGRHNPSRARFCAQCGLNLAASGACEADLEQHRRGRKGRGGVMLFLILLGLFLAAMGSLVSSRVCSSQPPVKRSLVPATPERGEPWMRDRGRGYSSHR